MVPSSPSRYISINQLQDLPEGIGRLNRLRYLDLSNNCLGEFPPAISSLRGLKELFVSENRLARIQPEVLSALSALTCLGLGHNKDLNSIPDAVCELAHLEHLYLHSTGLRRLPEALQALPRLKEITIHQTPLARSRQCPRWPCIRK